MDKFLEALITFLVVVGMIGAFVACMKATDDGVKAFFCLMTVASGILLLSRMKGWNK